MQSRRLGGFLALCQGEPIHASLHEDSDYGGYFSAVVKDSDNKNLDMAAVISGAAQMYHNSPKVLLATLQKEASGVTRQLARIWARSWETMAQPEQLRSWRRLASSIPIARSFKRRDDDVRLEIRRAPSDAGRGVTVTPATDAVAVNSPIRPSWERPGGEQRRGWRLLVLCGLARFRLLRRRAGARCESHLQDEHSEMTDATKNVQCSTSI